MAASVVAVNSSNTYPTGLAANDLLIMAVYVEPDAEASGSANYGTSISQPSGWTMFSQAPLNSNDANLTTQNTNRMYFCYKWSTGSESGAVSWTITSTGGTDVVTATGTQTHSGVYMEFGGIVDLRGITDTTSGNSGTPNMVFTSAVNNGSTGISAYPAVSASAPAGSVALLFGETWDSVAPTAGSWTEQYGSVNTVLYAFTDVFASAGSTPSTPTFALQAEPTISCLMVLSAAIPASPLPFIPKRMPLGA